MTPDEFTIAETFIEVSGGHRLYVQVWGNKDAATPIVFLHGGPGSGVNDGYRQRFNPHIQRIIFFDQRGAGRSTPYGSLEHNTTQDLVADIEIITRQLQLTQFVLTGGSWGSFLALAYAIEHPARVVGMALQGIFTGSQAEIDYMDRGGFATFFPDAWDEYLSHTPPTHQADPTAYHFKRILGKDEAAMHESAYIYENLERSLLHLDDRFKPADPATFDPAGIRLEVYYMANRCFVPDRFIMDNAHKLTMPIWIVQGRYDFVCPPRTAYELHDKAPGSILMWTMAGHGNDRSNYDVMRTITAQWS